MSRKRRTNNRNNLENEKPTRKSARLNNSKNDYSECQAQEKRTSRKFQRSINTCTVMITRSRGKCVEPDIGFRKSDESSITEENGTASTSDSDGNFVKTLTYSSSDSNTSKRNMSKRSNVLRNSCGQMVVECKKTVDEKESSEKENEQATNVEGMKSVKNQRGYNLRSKSKKQVAIESGSDASSVIEDKHVVTKKAQKTKLKDKKNENNTKHSVRDTETLKQFAKPSILNLDQEKGVKKSKGKKTGTLARKRELRDMLEQQDEGYEDDAFEGTPFRNIKPLIKYKLSPIILDTSIHCGSSDSQFKTPCSRTPVNRLRPAGPLSTGPSDSDTGIMTPGLLNSVNRNDIDRYVNRLKRRNMGLGCKTKIKCRTPFAKKHYSILQTQKSFDFDTNCNAQKSATIESEYCEEDYYWSDME